MGILGAVWKTAKLGAKVVTAPVDWVFSMTPIGPVLGPSRRPAWRNKRNAALAARAARTPTPTPTPPPAPPSPPPVPPTRPPAPAPGPSAVGTSGGFGPAGSPGTAGSPGSPGSEGPVGPQGEHGEQGSPGSQGESGPQGLQGERGPQGKAAEQPARQFSGSHYVGMQYGLTMSSRDARAYNALRAQRERIAQRGPRSYAPKHMAAFRQALAGFDARMNGIRGRYVDLPGTVRAAPSGPGFGRRLARGTGRAITGAVRTAGRTVLTPRVSAVRGRQAIVKGLWGKKRPLGTARRMP